MPDRPLKAAGYANIRELMPLEGRRVMLVTQHDEADWLAGDPAFVQIHFDDGSSIMFIFEEPDGRLFYETI